MLLIYTAPVQGLIIIFACGKAYLAFPLSSSLLEMQQYSLTWEGQLWRTDGWLKAKILSVKAESNTNG